MKKCPKCNKELNDIAKFCGGCGYKFPEASAGGEIKCPKCGAAVRAGGKFCGNCGNKIDVAAADAGNPADGNDVALVGSFIHWNILPGQLAVKIDARDIESYGKVVKGVSIQEGVKALLFVNGKIVAELGSGNYRFADWQKEAAKDDNPGIVRKFVGAICKILPQSWREKAEKSGLIEQKTPPFGLLLIRAAEFPLVFRFTDVQTATVSCEIGLHLLCKITNINDFYNTLLLDNKFVGFETVAEKLKTALRTQIGFAFKTLNPEQLSETQEVQAQLLPRLQAELSGVYPYIQISRIIQVSANNADLDNFRRMAEELYVSERELAELVRRNEFLTRLQAAKNEQELVSFKQGNAHELDLARVAVDNEAEKEKIYEQMQLTADERAKFDLMLAAQAKLRAAKTEDETATALNELKKSGLLRYYEIEDLRHQLEQKSKVRNVSDAQVLAMATMQNQMALDQQKLDWEIQVGNRRMQNKIDQQRMQDAYGDERRNADASFEDSRRRADIDIELEEQKGRLDVLKQAQAIRMERDEAAHRREVEEQKLAMEAEKAKLDAQNEEKRIYAGMTFEQIMAANPNLTPQAAQALAKKFEAEAAAAQNDKTAQMAIDQRDQMVAFMQQQMAMMKDMSMAGINAGAGHQQAMLNEKQAELERTRADASANSDRFVDGMKTTINAVGNMGRPTVVTPASGQVIVNTPNSLRVCPKCKTQLPAGATFCENCGEAL